jgi:hypothetical protein
MRLPASGPRLPLLVLAHFSNLFRNPERNEARLQRNRKPEAEIRKPN